METKVVTAHVPKDLADKIDLMASKLERSRGWIMKQALSAWIETEEERHRLTLEAMEEVSQGRVVDHSVVKAWADGLSSDK
jgi:predicted transcriptional regulator